MGKSVFSDEYEVFLRVLRETRLKAGLTQKELAVRLEQTQSFVSKCERGERRIDIVELRSFCTAMEVSFSDFVNRLDKEIQEAQG